MPIHAYSGRITARNNTLDTFTVANTDFCDLVTGTNQGTVVDEVTINSTVNATVIGTLRIFVYDSTEVPTSALHTQIPVSIVTGDPQNGTPTFSVVIRPLNVKLHHNQSLRFTFATASTSQIGFHLTASVTEL